MPMKKDSSGQQKEKIPRKTTMTVTDEQVLSTERYYIPQQKWARLSALMKTTRYLKGYVVITKIRVKWLYRDSNTFLQPHTKEEAKLFFAYFKTQKLQDSNIIYSGIQASARVGNDFMEFHNINFTSGLFDWKL